MQRTAYEMRISDWSSVVCSSDLLARCDRRGRAMSRFRRTFTATAADIDELGHVNNAVWVEWIQALAVAPWEAVAPADQHAAYIWVVTRPETDYRGHLLAAAAAPAETPGPAPPPPATRKPPQQPHG